LRQLGVQRFEWQSLSDTPTAEIDITNRRF